MLLVNFNQFLKVTIHAKTILFHFKRGSMLK